MALLLLVLSLVAVIILGVLYFRAHTDAMRACEAAEQSQAAATQAIRERNALLQFIEAHYGDVIEMTWVDAEHLQLTGYGRDESRAVH